MESVALEDLRKKMAEFAKERDWDQFHSPRNLLLALMMEINAIKYPVFHCKGSSKKHTQYYNLSGGGNNDNGDNSKTVLAMADVNDCNNVCKK